MQLSYRLNQPKAAALCDLILLQLHRQGGGIEDREGHVSRLLGEQLQLPDTTTTQITDALKEMEAVQLIKREVSKIQRRTYKVHLRTQLPANLVAKLMEHEAQLRAVLTHQRRKPAAKRGVAKQPPRGPEVDSVTAYKIVMLLDLQQHGPIISEDGSALITRANLPEILAPGALHTALEGLLDEALVERYGRRIRLRQGLDKLPRLRAWLNQHATIAMDHLKGKGQGQVGRLHSPWPAQKSASATPAARPARQATSPVRTATTPSQVRRATAHEIDEIDQLVNLVRRLQKELEQYKADNETKEQLIEQLKAQKAKLQARVDELEQQLARPVTGRYPDLAQLLRDQ